MVASPFKVSDAPAIRQTGNVIPNFHKMPQWQDALFFAASGASPYTIPAGASFIHIMCDVDIVIQTNGGTASKPAANISDGSGVSYLPAKVSGPWWAVSPGAIISVFATAAGNVYIEVWS